MKRNIKIYEMPLLYLTLLLILFGAVMQYSASSTIAINKFGWNNYNYFLYKHLTRVVLGISGMLLMYKLELKWLKKYSKQILILSWAIILFAYIFNAGTTRRFLVINGRNIFTTSDFARFALIIFTANFIASNKKNINTFKTIFSDYVIYALITLALILYQPDLSSAFIISCIIISMLIIGGLKIKYFLYTILSGISTLVLSIMFYPYMRNRFLSWFSNSNPDPSSQVERAKQALHNGGIFGNGFSESIIKEGFLAEGHTDFILPIIGEEIGFFGILIIFFIFYFLYFLSISTAKHAPNIFSSLLCIGIAFNILFYFLINSAYVVGLIPPTGIAIPFISYGGSFFLTCSIMLGIINNAINNNL